MPVSVESIAGLEFFSGLPDWAVQIVAQGAHEVSYDAGDVMLHQHDEVEVASFLLSGSVQFLLQFEGVHDLLVGATAEAGGLIGWSMFRAPYRSTATVRCYRPCRLLTVPREAFDEIFVRDPRLHYNILRRVASVAAGRLMRSRQILLLAPEQNPPEGAGY